VADFLIPGIGCAAVLVIAALSSLSDLRKCAVLFVAGWTFYASSWVPNNAAWYLNSPAQMIWMLTGWAIDPEKLWAAADVIIGASALSIAGQRLWGACLFILYLEEVILHTLHAWGWSFSSYAQALNIAFWMQVALLLLAGGRHAVSFVSRYFNGWRWRSLRMWSPMASQKTETAA